MTSGFEGSRSGRFVQRLTGSRPGAWLAARLAHRLDRPLFRLSGGRTSLTALLTGLPLVMLTTRGAKSGQPRTVPLLAIHDPQRPEVLALVASNWGQSRHPAWYYNLRAHPYATCAWNGRVGEYVAREAEGAEYGRLWQLAVQLYPGYSGYAKRAKGRRIPIIFLAPVDEDKDWQS